jgi:cytochrome c biogenesis protein CcmG/thiol:disulfide interchange protein DsbE
MIATMRAWAPTIAATVAVAVVAAGCGSDQGSGNPESAATDYERALAGAPAPLGMLYEQANELLPGGLDAFQARLEELRGHPVVVNKWASWCGPCRAEFPFFQSQAAKRGTEVAFIGVDAQDSEDAARTFLEQLPVPYPSYVDPDLKISAELDAATEFPATIFLDRKGEVAFVHRGGYQSEEDLEGDIERHARPG